jgi:hypothetical protein
MSDPLLLVEAMRVASHLKRALFSTVVESPTLHHHYTTPMLWEKTNLFYEADEFIRHHGYSALFFGDPYPTMDIDGYSYWSNGNRELAGTSIRREAKNYEEVDPCFAPSPEFEETVNARVSKIIRGRVLQVGIPDSGCILDHFRIPAASYTCIDTRAMAIQQAQFDYGAYDGCFIRTSFEDHYRDGYDTILALFGCADQIGMELVNRIPFMLRRGGIAILMFHADRNGNDQTHDDYEHFVVRSWYDLSAKERGVG